MGDEQDLFPIPTDPMAAFGIFGRPGQGFKRLFMSHPPIEERVEALRRTK